ncbi:hypothetical protein V8C34DRAFT_291764 [Trichoderma compactum]
MGAGTGVSVFSKSVVFWDIWLLNVGRVLVQDGKCCCQRVIITRQGGQTNRRLERLWAVGSVGRLAAKYFPGAGVSTTASLRSAGTTPTVGIRDIYALRSSSNFSWSDSLSSSSTTGNLYQRASLADLVPLVQPFSLANSSSLSWSLRPFHAF